jgi:hypothetical protein
VSERVRKQAGIGEEEFTEADDMPIGVEIDG